MPVDGKPLSKDNKEKVYAAFKTLNAAAIAISKAKNTLRRALHFRMETIFNNFPGIFFVVFLHDTIFTSNNLVYATPRDLW